MRQEQKDVTYEIKSIWKGGGSNTQQECLHINLNKKPCAIKLPLSGILGANEQDKGINFIPRVQVHFHTC